MDWSQVKSLTIEEGEVISITQGANVLWKKAGRNLLNPATVPNENKYIDRTTGGTGNPSATGGEWRHSGYIPVTEGTKYYFGQIHATATRAGTAWYNANKVFISGVNATTLQNNKGILTSPENAVYMRHCWRVDTGFNTDWEHTVYICVNGDLDHWEPYVG